MSVEQWRKRLDDWGLLNLAGVLLDVMEPLSPFVAHLLWVMQPTLGLIMSRDTVGHWAQRLEDPQAVVWLREQLLEEIET